VSDPMLPVGTNRCQCMVCGRYFGGVSGFDAHQTVGADGRPICHDPGGLTNKKGELLGYVLNKYGYWSMPMPEDAIAAFTSGQHEEECTGVVGNTTNVKETTF